ncbi:sacsin N-terminal ATP-binding-like domain-containing protein [Actinocorallia libanotica]|uniref:Molecular chaperone Hsp90 n=1 Tax=Actinocorallia libanotica TaxID=46162 RepID=A0ABN1QLI3_9ACTN
MDDPFGTAGLRARVLDAWTASPARFREDANAEEDYALGAYRDRVLIELAQNAADAAQRAGVPGHLRLELRDGTLTAANTGAPLTAEGVASLSSLRASTKRGADAAGRFGVGFTAVVSVSDAPSVASLTGAVAWSAKRTRALVEAVPGLAGEAAARHGHVPVLRLPFPAEGSVPEGFATQVVLPLRDAAAERSLRARLAELGAPLLLALPALATLTIITDGGTRLLRAARPEPGAVTVTETRDDAPEGEVSRWRTVEAHGRIPDELLADRPAEERDRPFWSVRWAVRAEPRGPLDALPAGGEVLYAPTPTDEPLDLPALLIASVPLASDRRRVEPGPLTDFLVARAADAYLDLLAGTAGPALLDLVPGPVPAGALDGALRRIVLRRLPETPLLPLAEDVEDVESTGGSRGAGAADAAGGFGNAGSIGNAGIADAAHGVEAAGDVESAGGAGIRVRGRDAVVVDGPASLVAVLGGVVPGLLPAGWPAGHRALRALGVRRMGPADVVDALAGLDREPGWWRGVYDALAGVDPGELGALPVPLADGRLVRGPRGVLLARDLPAPERLRPLGLRVADPAADHPLLVRLGAVEAGPRQVLADPAVRAAVEGSLDLEDPQERAELADAVLTLTGALSGPADSWLAELALPGADGEPYPAGELMFEDAPLRRVMGEDSPFGIADPELVGRYGAEALENAGVLRGFALLRAEDVDLNDPDAPDELSLDGLEEWDVPSAHLPELTAVRDLELVEDWEAALRLLALPPWREAVVAPLALPDGTRVPSYTSWWLARHRVLGGPRRARGADPLLEGLYDPAPEFLDPEFALALGVRRSLEDVPPDELLELLADPARPVRRDQLRALWTWLSHAAELDPPDEVRAVTGTAIEVVPAEDAIVVDVPYALPLLADQPLVLLPHDRAGILAELLELPRASEEVPDGPDAPGEEREVPRIVRELFPEAPEAYRHHDRLVVQDREVSWWYDGGPHASGPAGLARAIAWELGRWGDRQALQALLADPDDAALLLAEADLS